MSGFRWAYDLNGSKVPLVRPMYIPTATAIEKGEVLKFTPGTGIVVGDASDTDTAHIGVAVNEHEANSGTEIKVSISPMAVYAHKSTNIITATGGSTTTFVVSGLLPQIDDLWIDGCIEIVTCAADSSMIGRRLKITDSDGSDGSVTFAAQTAAFASGDTARICPGPRAIGEYGWDLDGDGMNIDWDTDGGESLILVDVDPDNMTSYWMLRLHTFGNDGLTIT